MIPREAAFVLVDGAEWGMDGTAGRRAIPFPERVGEYGGPPADDEAAVSELERQRRAGASHVVVGWPAFWWLDHYTGLRHHLESTAELVRTNERLRVWDLRNGGG